jgi:YVTN family beta-propeller protein
MKKIKIYNVCSGFWSALSRILPITFVLLLVNINGHSQTAYVTNRDGNSVSVINTETNTVTNTIGVGNQPMGVSVSSDGTKVYVSNITDSTVSVINTASNTVSATIHVGYGPWGLSVNNDGSKVYVANDGTNTVSVINTTADTIEATITVGTYPLGIAVNPNGTKAYVGNYDDGTVSVINTATNMVSATIIVGSAPYGITVSPDGSKLYVVNNGDNTLSVINTATNVVSATITVGSNPYGVSVSPDGSLLIIANNWDYTASVINTSTYTVISTITVGTAPWGVSFSPDGSKAYVANEFDSTVSVINTSTYNVIGTIPVGYYPVAFGNFISIYSTPTGCSAQFLLYADTTQLHHYFITDSITGIPPFHYFWTWGDSTYDTIPNPSHTYADTGIYTICLNITDSTGCHSTYCDSSYHIMRVSDLMAYVSVISILTTGIEANNKNESNITIYPNPVSTILNIHSQISILNSQLRISDILGNEVYKETLNGIDNSLDISGLSDGVYFYRVISDKQSQTGKFVVEK